MKTLLLAALACAALSSAALAEDPSGRLGGGIEVGEQNGLTAKYWTRRDQAIAGGLGESDGELSLHGEYLWHAWDLLPRPPKGSLAADLGLGGRLRDDEFGIRTTVGLAYWLPENPVEVFFDAGPIFRVAPETATDFTVALGVRAYLAKR